MTLSLNTFRSMLQKLLERSKNEEVDWYHDPQEDTFNVDVEEGTMISVFQRGPPEASEMVGVVFRAHYRVMMATTIEQDHKDWPLLHGLFLEAKRFVEGIEDEVEKVEHALAAEEKVGQHHEAEETPLDPPDKQEKPAMEDLTDGDSGFSAERAEEKSAQS